MSRLILYMAMSLDGFITGPGDDKGSPAGVDGMRLQQWLGKGGPEVADFRPSDARSQIVFDEMLSTGAVITGRNDREGHGLGDNGGRLFNWLDDRMSTGPSGQVLGELMATGATTRTTLGCGDS